MLIVDQNKRSSMLVLSQHKFITMDPTTYEKEHEQWLIKEEFRFKVIFYKLHELLE